MKKGITLLVLFFLSLTSLAQVGVNNPNPDTTSILDLTSSKLGLLIPRMSSFNRLAIGDPANSLFVYDTDDAMFYYYDNTFSGTQRLNWTAVNPFLLRDDDTFPEIVSAGASDGSDTTIYMRDVYTQGTVRFVGIGTSNPLNTLSVKGNLSIGTTTEVAPINGVYIEGQVTLNSSLNVEDTVTASVLQGVGEAPIGGIIMWSGSTADADLPEGWKLCDGRVYGSVTTPDLSGRFIVGVGKSSDGDQTYSVDNTGGEETHQLSESEIPSHLHAKGTLSTSTTGAHTHEVDFTQGNGIGSRNRLSEVDNDGTHTKTTSSDGDHSHTITGSTGSTGGDSAHENRPPYYALAYIMRIK